MSAFRSLLVASVLCLLQIGTVHAQWVQTNGPYGGFVQCFAVSGTNLFAGTSGGGVWRRPLSEMVSVRLSASELATEFSLGQNYPNPFNPTTVVSFELPVSSLATLKVYNVLGQGVATLVNEALQPDSYEVTFDGTGLASGVYYYQLQANGFCSDAKTCAAKIESVGR